MSITPHLSSSGSFIINAVFVDSDGNQQSVQQLIRVSDKIAGVNGFIFENDLTTVVSPSGEYHMVFPVVLSANFESIKATNGSLNCSNGFNIGSSCSYFVDINALADNTLIETKLEGFNGGILSASRSYASIGSTSNRANLVMSQPEDIYLTESNASGVSNVTLFNNGTNIASSLDLSLNDNSNNKLSIINNDCSNVLLPNSSCNFMLQAVSDDHGSGSINVDYNYGSGSDSVANNVYYINPKLPARLKIQSVSGSLTNSFVGISNYEDLTLSLSGTNKLTNIAYQLERSTNEFSLAGVNLAGIRACGASGSFDLIIGQPCAVRVRYTPLESTTLYSSYTLSAGGSYLDESAANLTLSSQITRPYSALSTANALAISTLYINMVAQKDTTQMRELYLSNISPYLITLGEMTFNPLVSGLSFGGQVSVGSSCAASGQLLASGGGSCGITLNYAPTEISEQEISKLLIPVSRIADQITPADTQREVTLAVSAVAKLAPAEIKVAISPLENPLPTGVTKIADNQYNVLALSGTSLKLAYTFSASEGRGAAVSFNVNGISLPIGAEIITQGSTCPINLSLRTLNPGSSCTVIVSLPQEIIISTGLLNSGRIALALSYSWQSINADGGMEFNTAVTPEQIVNINTQWLTNFEVKASPFKNLGNGFSKTTLLASLGSPVAASQVLYPVSIRGKMNGLVQDAANCSINSALPTCQFELSIPSSAPTGIYYIDVSIEDSTELPNKRIYKITVPATKND